MALAKLSKAQEIDIKSKGKKKSDASTILPQSRNLHKESVPPCRTMNKEHILKELSCLFQRIRRIRPQFQERGSRLHLHENPISSTNTQQEKIRPPT
jgi:hypothetical protein